MIDSILTIGLITGVGAVIIWVAISVFSSFSGNENAKRFWGKLQKGIRASGGSSGKTLVQWAGGLLVVWLAVSCAIGISQALLKDMTSWNTAMWGEEETSEWRQLRPAEIEQLVSDYWTHNAQHQGWHSHTNMPYVDANGDPRYQFTKEVTYDCSARQGEWEWLGMDITHMEEGKTIQVHFPDRDPSMYEADIQTHTSYPPVSLDEGLIRLETASNEAPFRFRAMKKQGSVRGNVLRFSLHWDYRPRQARIATEQSIEGDDLYTEDVSLPWGALPHPQAWQYDVSIRLFDGQWKPLDMSEFAHPGGIQIYPANPEVELIEKKTFLGSELHLSSATLHIAEKEVPHLVVIPPLPKRSSQVRAIRVVVILNVVTANQHPPAS